MSPRTVPVFDPEAIRKLAADHQRLAAQVQAMQVMLRSFMAGADELPKKQFGRATFGAAFTTSNATVTGTLTDQWGFGVKHHATSITLRNMLTDVANTYLYHGSSGGACWCFYTGVANEWIMVVPQCP